jgi:hypothetical protein
MSGTLYRFPLFSKFQEAIRPDQASNPEQTGLLGYSSLGEPTLFGWKNTALSLK